VLLSLFWFPTRAKYEQSGVTFTNGKYCPNVTFDSPKALMSLEHIASTGANWVAIVVTQYQVHMNSTEIFPLYNPEYTPYYTFITATVDQLTSIINRAHALDLKVMLKPHIDITHPINESIWRGWIGTGFNDAQWGEWFASYTNFLIPYAKLAEELKVEQFSLSCELVTASSQAMYWRRLIATVRENYHGVITDSGNWGGEEVQKSWWDAVDLIGVDAYYPILKDVPDPTLDELVGAWKPIVMLLKNISTFFKKPLAFTEIGYCSGACSRDGKSSPLAQKVMALHYQAALEAFKTETTWFKGFFWWSWNTDPANGGENDNCITPQFKEAEMILRQYYEATKPMPPRPSFPPVCACIT